MCGIAGAVGSATGIEKDVYRMASTLWRRGPDGHDVWSGEGVSLGHARLSIIDLSEAGRQPMISADGRYVLVLNGEIYNARALRQRLDLDGPSVEWRGHSDTEVLLEWVSRHGLVSAMEASVGMFALGLWDRREQRLSLARDRAGEKPMYYGFSGSTLIFASELKALRAVAGFSPDLEPSAEAAFASLGHVPSPLCIYRDARKLPPGSWLSWTSSQGRDWPEVQRWWSVEAVAAGGKANMIHEQDAVDDALDGALRRSIDRQMISDVPIGAFLSGGIDSSLIVALMQAQSHLPVKTFTVAFDDAAFDESSSAAEVARHLGTDHHALRVTDEEARSVVPLLPDMYDEPFADASQIPTSLIAAFARGDVKVALSGDGGDELFAGYNRYRLLPIINGVFEQWPKPARALAAASIGALPHRVVETIAKRAGVSGLTARRVAELSEMLRFAHKPAALYEAALRIWPLASPHQSEDVQKESFLEFMMLRDFLGYLPNDVLCKIDRAAMYHSLESRCPYLDPEVVSLAWRIPTTMKLAGGVGKLPLRRLLARYVPSALFDRPKAGFTPPIDRWIRGPLAEWADRLLRPEQLARQSAFDSATVTRIWQQHRAGNADHGRRLWPVLMFSAWQDRWVSK